MNLYLAIYNGRRKEIMASSLYGAKQAAVAYFNAPSRRYNEIGIYLVEKANGEAVDINAQIN